MLITLNVAELREDIEGNIGEAHPSNKPDGMSLACYEAQNHGRNFGLRAALEILDHYIEKSDGAAVPQRRRAPRPHEQCPLCGGWG